jgi:hypothetical protein
MNMIKKASLSSWIKHRYDEAAWITTHHPDYHEKFHFRIKIITKRLSDLCWKHSINNTINELPSRLDMPNISGAAHKTLSTRPEYNNPGNRQPFKVIDIKNQEATLDFCRIEKSSMRPRLEQLKQILDDATKVAALAYENWNKLSKLYECLDRQEKILIHQQKIATKASKPSTKKPSSTEQDPTKLAMKILANLSPEEQAKILAIIQKQSI